MQGLLKAALIILAIRYVADESLSMYQSMIIMSLSYIDTAIEKPNYIILEKK